MTDREFAVFIRAALPPHQVKILARWTACGPSARDVVIRALNLLDRADRDEQDRLLKQPSDARTYDAAVKRWKARQA